MEEREEGRKVGSRVWEGRGRKVGFAHFAEER